MNGPHDMGGMQCYGPVLPEKNEPLFHRDWEKRAMALTVAMGFCGEWNIDISRHEREKLPPDFYLSKTYYQIWLHGLQNLMLDREMVTRTELETGELTKPGIEVKRVVNAGEMSKALAKGGPVDRARQSEPKFRIGDRVRTNKDNPQSHTRLPRYARDAVGIVNSVQGFHVFPDSNAKGEGENSCWVYNIGFEAAELFGPGVETDHVVMIDCWEPYLERV